MLFTPVYWMMMSIAAWRAVWQLWRKPHLWEKTPHRPIATRCVSRQRLTLSHQLLRSLADDLRVRLADRVEVAAGIVEHP